MRAKKSELCSLFMNPVHLSRSSFLPQSLRSTSAAVLFISLVAAGLAVVTPSVHAANPTWTNTATGGAWSSTGNWSGGTVADGSGIIADFSTLDITADNTVHFDSSRTLGGLIFSDTTKSPSAYNNWTLDNNANAANILTLAGTTPTITVTNGNATISAVIADTANSGLTTAVTSSLTLSGLNTYTGATTFNANNGTVTINTIANSGIASSLGAGSAINIAAGTSFTARLNYTGAAASTDRSISIATGQTLYVFNNAISAGTLLFTGAVANGCLFSSRVGTIAVSGLMSGTGGVQTNSGGILVLTNDSNSFSGGAQIYSGTLSGSSIADTGTNSALGNGGSIAFNGAGTLKYTGTGKSTNRVVTLNASSTGGSIDQSGTGLLKFTGSFSNAGVGSQQILNLQGSTTGSGEIASVLSDRIGSTQLATTFPSGATTITLATVNGLGTGTTITGSGIASGTTVQSIAGNVVTLSKATTGTGSATQVITAAGLINQLALSKSGTGTWILSGPNTYTGTTTISGGTLQLGVANAIAQSSSVVFSGGTLASGGVFAQTLGTQPDGHQHARSVLGRQFCLRR